MKFGIYRTSEAQEWEDRPQPVPEATPISFHLGNSRTVQRWEIEFNTLDELLSFIKKYNEIVETGGWAGHYVHIIIDANSIAADLPWEFEIEIQDTYRE